VDQSESEFPSRLAVRDAIAAAHAVQDRSFAEWQAASPDSVEQESARASFASANEEVNRLLLLYNEYRGR
jgi:hypothetical protein